MQNSINNSSRLVLGTAQLGFNYGIANLSGRPNYSAAVQILKCAWKGGIRLLDTAQTYGVSEAIIARFLRDYPEYPFGVITKLNPKIKASDGQSIKNGVDKCRKDIGRPLSGIMFHDGAALSLLNNDGRKVIRQYIVSGVAAAFGVSVYTPDEFRTALNENTIDIIQAPFNVLDRRLLESGLLERAADLGKKVFLRSVYLQGLLLMEPSDLPPTMTYATQTIEGWRSLCKKYTLSPLQAALGFVRTVAPDTGVVIGCETLAQMDENLAAIHMSELDPDFLTEVESLRVDDPRTFDPSTWT